ncbi:MAG TPA: hypothetical protein VHB25_06020 [Gemmatimonadaceae bacterium]|nr:hypothetical protein [Gemmatimonadaceae bacterium]
MSVRILAFVVGALVAGAARAPVAAQRPDSVPPAIPRIPPATASLPADSLQPPLTPRRAFFYSFLLPGYSQTVLGRNKAAASFMLVEAISLGMIRESGADVHEARRTMNDTLVISYVDAQGNPLVVPDTARPRFTNTEVRTRRAHVEDWVALLVANHLFAGADAYVAAHLWDVPARLGLRLLPNHGAVLSASMAW